MKKRILAITSILAMGIVSAQAAQKVIDFGYWNADEGINWNSLSESTEADGSLTYSKTQDGITFDLNVAGYSYTNDLDITGTSSQTNVNTFPNGAGVGVSGNGSDTRINDGQYMKFTISVSSGADILSSLAFTNLNIRYESATAGVDNRTLFDNSGNSVTYNNGGADPRVNYSADTITGAGLNQLTLATTNTWSLNYAGLLSGSDGVTALGQVSFAYEFVDTTITNYTGTLRLGTGEMAGETYTNSPVTWDTASALWGVGPLADKSAWTNWIEGSDAIFGVGSAARMVNLATNLNVTADEIELDGDAALWFTGVSNSAEIVTITNQMRTALAKTSRWIYLNNANVGGSFEIINVGRLSFQGDSGVEAGTEITILDAGDIAFNSSEVDFTGLTLVANGSQIFNQSASDKTLGSLSGNGEFHIAGGTTLAINDITVGGISNVASFTAAASSIGNLQMGPGTHNFSINPTTAVSDQMAIGTGTNLFGGDLVVLAVNTNKLAIGDSFKLFDAGAYAGTFNSIVLPTNNLPAGAEFYVDDLGVDGTISVAQPGFGYKFMNFTDFLGSSTWAQTNAAYTEGSLTNAEGTILTLRISIVEHHDVTEANKFQLWPYNTSVGGLRRTTADGGNNNARLDSFDATPGVTNTANDEIIKFELFVSGMPVDALALKDLRIDAMAIGEVAEFNDGSNTITHIDVGGSDIVGYGDVLSGLTPLSIGNVATWSLEVASRDNNNTTLNTISFDDFRFSLGYQHASSFDLWTEAYGLSGDDAQSGSDPDSDNVNNLYEYGLNGDPTNAANRGQLEFGATEDGMDFIYIYPRRTAANSGIDYSLATSENLVYDNAWTNNDTVVDGVGPDEAGFEAVTNSTATDVEVKFIQLFIEEN
jgi:hypothetical protein